MTSIRSTLIGVAAALALGVAAQAFPDRPVTHVMPFNPGGATAWSALNGMPGDGHTIMGTNLPHIILQPLLQKPGYKTEDIVNVYMFHFTPDALLVRADSPYRTLQDVIDAAAAAPGALTVSGSGPNSANDVANQQFRNLTGAHLTYIPYSGTAPSTTALLGGEVEMSWGYTTVAASQGDQVRMLAVAMEQRHPLFPDVPTFRELGFDMVDGAYRGIAAPAGTPEDSRRALSDIIAAINADPAFIRQMEERGFAMLDVPYDAMDAWMARQAA